MKATNGSYQDTEYALSQLKPRSQGKDTEKNLRGYSFMDCREVLGIIPFNRAGAIRTIGVLLWLVLSSCPIITFGFLLRYNKQKNYKHENI